MTDITNVKQELETGNPKGTKEQRRAWALRAVKARWAKDRAQPLNQQPLDTVIDGMTVEQIGADMSMSQAAQLTPAQKKVRQKVRKAMWWRRKYQLEKAGLAPATTVTNGKTAVMSPEEAKKHFARQYYQRNKERIRERQRAYEARVRLMKGEVSTQPVEQPVVPVPLPSVANAVQIKVHVCGVCGARHYAVKE